MLLFSAIDGLGRLYHPDENARVTKRIEYFINFMGGEYSENKNKLSDLRHSLIHNAINYESFMSHEMEFSIKNLETIGKNEFLFVNTQKMSNDFKSAFERFKMLLNKNEELMLQAANRLDWISIETSFYDMTNPTPPPPIEFISVKEKVERSNSNLLIRSQMGKKLPLTWARQQGSKPRQSEFR